MNSNSNSINQVGVFSKAIGCVTNAFRALNTVNNEIGDVISNMVPYPRIHFFGLSYSPLAG